MSSSVQEVQHYAAEEGGRGMIAAARGVLGYPLTIAKHRGLIWNFCRRELLGRFRGSMLGMLWVLVHPLFLFAVYYLVFGYLFGNAKLPDGSPDPGFAVYLFSGIIVWSSFNEATLRACSVVVDNGNLVKKVKFPCELLPVHLVIVSLVVYFVGAGVLLSVGIPFGIVRPDWNMLAWPAVLVVHFFFTLGFGLILANLYVFLRDTTHLYTIISQAWFFASPIFWFPSFILKGLPGVGPHLMLWNPAYPLIQAHRQVLGMGYETARGFVTPEPLWQNLAIASAWAVVFMVIGYGSFMSRRHKYADLV